MCPSSWKLYVDDFPFFGSSLARLEPELKLFEVWEIINLQSSSPFLEYNGQNVFRTVEKSQKNQTVWLQQSSKFFFKKCHILTIFPVLGKLTHMICAQESIFWGKNGRFGAKHHIYFQRKQKLWYPLIRKPPFALFYWLGMALNGSRRRIFGPK